MDNITNVIEDLVYSNPQLLLAFENHEEIGLKYLPYSTGFEIECSKLNTYNEDSFRAIPDILDVSNDDSEQRYRIPNGLKGLICLHKISQILIENSAINELSGNHFHTDMTDTYHLINQQFVDENKNWILEELDTWNYPGKYNKRDVRIEARCWVRFKTSTKTMEVRIGEMTFDYSILAKRIIHCNSIARKLKEILNRTKQTQGLYNTLSNIKVNKTTCINDDEIENIIRQRLIRC